MGNQGVGGEHGGVLDGDDSDFQQMIDGILGNAMAENDFHAVLAEEARGGGAAGIGDAWRPRYPTRRVSSWISKRAKDWCGEVFGELVVGGEGNGDPHEWAPDHVRRCNYCAGMQMCIPMFQLWASAGNQSSRAVRQDWGMEIHEPPLSG